jgi:nitroimidazol reductase NimA-like FMN-containing flavoprotein (pyridoxamine 5'-phosphate oxidase superfamily)/N-acetylglutamate synthase-like GNAT family acetyltransferase
MDEVETGSFAPTPRTTLLHAGNATYDRATVYSILDDTMSGFVAAVADGQPMLRPMSHIRIDENIFLHGHRSNRLLTHLSSGVPLSFAVASIDGIVLGRRIDTHTINFRSVMVHGHAEPILDREAKLGVLRYAFDRLAPDRWELLAPLSPAYVDDMTILRIPLVECVAKIRSGMPSDWTAPADPGVWAGVIPLSLDSIAPNPPRATVEGLLARAGLPTNDLPELDLRSFFCAGSRDEPLGLVGLQIDRPHALLRSLVVEPAARNAGLGSRLVAHAERHARSRGVTSIYLLTTTAEPFFRARGYVHIPREAAPDFVRRTREFADLCPASSAFMLKSFLGPA